MNGVFLAMYSVLNWKEWLPDSDVILKLLADMDYWYRINQKLSLIQFIKNQSLILNSLELRL